MAVKRKVWMIVTVCLAVVLIAAACLVGVAAHKGIGFSEAMYIETKHGHMLLIKGSPISMSGRDGLFDDLTSGDRVLVAHGLIAESYPGQAKAYLCIKRSDGTEEDIPARVRASLKQMGWLEPATLSEDEAVALAHLYTGFCFDIVEAKQDSDTGEWTIQLWTEDRERHETVYISADGQDITIDSGIIYR